MLRLIILLPFLILLVVFVLLNQTPGTMELPYFSWQSSPGVIALIAAVAFFLVGALTAWIASFRQRSRARRAEQQVRTLETQLAELRTELAQSAARNAAQSVALGGVAVGGGLHPAPGTGVMPPPAAY